MTGAMIQGPAISSLGGDASSLAGRAPGGAVYWIGGHAIFWLTCSALGFPRGYSPGMK